MEEENIFLFIPNLIGYARIILNLVSFYFMPTDYAAACSCYLLSGLLDAFDGHAARKYNQSTKFGAMLDQLTDRCGTMCLLITLATFYPKYAFLFQVSASIDIACHWLFLHTSLLQGKTSHKLIDLNESVIMSIYYNKSVLFFMCAFNEVFYASLYLLHFTEGPSVGDISLLRAAAYFTGPLALIKALISLVHGYVACCNIGRIDQRERAAAALKNK